MADVSDAADGLVQIIAAAVYPNGTTQPSIGNVPIIIYQGWPNSQTLENDLAAGKVHISVFPQPGDTVTSIVSGDDDWDELDNDGTQGHGIREIRRQTRKMQIVVWAPTPTLRSQIGGQVDAALAVTSRMIMPDTSTAVLTYVNSTQHDEQQKIMIYRRDLFYAANYATIQVVAEFAIKHVVTNIDDALGVVVTVQTPNP